MGLGGHIATSPPPALTLLPLQGLLDGHGRYSWQPKSFPADRKEVKFLPVSQGLEAQCLAAWAVVLFGEELELITETGATPKLYAWVGLAWAPGTDG